MKPSMKVHELPISSPLLAGSETPPGFSGPLGYAPGIGENDHHQA